MVPAKNGAIPETPGGWHSSRLGTLFDLAAVPGADEPPDPDVAGATAADLLAPSPAPEPPVGDVAAVALLGAVAEIDGAAMVPGNATAPYTFLRPVPEMLEVWAAAGPPARRKTATSC